MQDLFQAQSGGAEYLQRQLITYIGNKRALLPFLASAVDVVKARKGKKRIASLDLFSGTGVVARLLKDHSSRLIANDLERYSEATNQCFLTSSELVEWARLRDSLEWCEKEITKRFSPGWIARLYAPMDDKKIQAGERVFFTTRNAAYLDTSRQILDELDASEKALLLGPLLAKASVHANTSGVFKGFYKDRNGVGQFGGHGKDALTRILRPINLELPFLTPTDCEWRVTREDANELIRRPDLGEFDLAYLDPPYNQHPYGSNYFMLNLVADYVEPQEISSVSGIPIGWNRSRYNQRREATTALLDIVERCPASHLLISYNSEGFITQELFERELAKIGNLRTMSTPYNTFRGSRNLRDRPIHVTEFLFLLEKN